MDFQSKIEKINKSLRQVNSDNAKKTVLWFTKRLPDISHLKNIVLFSGIASLLIFILFSQRFAALYEYIPKRPVVGGVYTEGVIGNIEQFNPLYSPLNSAEDSVSKLIYSGLTKKNDERNVVPDLAEKWEVSADGRTYKFFLKQNLKWSDGQQLTASDVVFTINTIQNPDVKSPLLEIWKGVEASNPDEQTVEFRLKNAYPNFLSVTNVAIIPKHLLENVPPRNIKTAEFSIKPVGSGPYIMSGLKKIRESSEVVLETNENYFGNKPYITTIIIKSYPDQTSLTNGYVKREIKGIESINGLQEIKDNKLPKIQLFSSAVPVYDALYFNLRTGISKDKNFRQAISLAVDREKLSQTVYNGRATKIYSAILPGFLGYNSSLKQEFDLAKAKSKLLESGYVAGADGILTKDGQRVTLRLVTSNDPEKSKEADLIAVNLGLLGIETKVEKYPTNALVQDYMRPRNFDLLLISQNIGDDSDLYPFWHATQVNDPGLNFSGFSDRRVDKYLEQARSLTDITQKSEKVRNVVQIIWDEVGAVYLVRPDYIYGISNEIKGVKVDRLTDPTDRFWNITDWYILDERIDK